MLEKIQSIIAWNNAAEIIIIMYFLHYMILNFHKKKFKKAYWFSNFDFRLYRELIDYYKFYSYLPPEKYALNATIFIRDNTKKWKPLIMSK